MPSIGLGTAWLTSKESIVQAVLECGYRHVDTASAYNNEDVVGEALQEVFSRGVNREDVFVTTKLWHTHYHDVEGALRASLQKLKLQYVDLYLIHAPLGYYSEPKMPMHVLWEEMEKLVEKGLAKSIGVSNFTAQMIWDLLSYCKIQPVCNQIELNP